MAETSQRMLLLEDDFHLAEIRSIHLRNEGYAVQHTAGGRSDLLQVKRGGWDAVILNLMLPGVDRLEISRPARDVARYTPIIMISAHGSKIHRALGLEMGADDYLSKPFSVAELLTRLKALLRRLDAVIDSLRFDSRGTSPAATWTSTS